MNAQNFNPFRWARWVVKEFVGIFIPPVPKIHPPSPAEVVAKQLSDAELGRLNAAGERMKWQHTEKMHEARIKYLKNELGSLSMRNQEVLDISMPFYETSPGLGEVQPSPAEAVADI